MDKKRIILLGVALATGGGAFAMVAMGGEEPRVVVQSAPREQGPTTVRVLVAGVTVERGDLIDPAETSWAKWPVDSVPAHVVTEEDEAFFESLGRRRARTTIYEGEPIIEAKTVEPGDRGMMSALLSPGMVAVSANISGQNAASGFVLPGDRVDVVAAERGQDAARTAFSDLRVIAIDANITQENGPMTMPGSLVTFELRPDQVEAFVTLRDEAEMNLVLKSMFDAAVPDVPASEIVVLRYGAGRGM